MLAAALAVAASVMPAVAQAGASTPAPRIKVFASGTAAGSLSFLSRVRITPILVRPKCANAPRVASFVGVELTRPGSPFTYFGLVWCDGSSLSGRLTANEWTAQETGYASTGGSLPQQVETSPVWLSVGRYQITVVSRGATTVELAVEGERQPTRAMIASNRTAVGENWAAFDGSAAASSAYRRLSLQVPAGSHVALLMDEQNWNGAGDTAYAYNACFGAAQLPCAAGPVPGIYPDVRVGDGAAAGAVIVVNPLGGSRTANYYTAQSGITTHQELLALALP